MDIHQASHEERLEAYRNVHEVWGGSFPLEEYVKQRSRAPQHNRADWFVGRLDNRVVSSLGCYPLQLHVRGELIDGFAIGSVHTLPAYRRRGCAAELLSWVENKQIRRGASLSLLYSDIDPTYYARLGYRRCPSWEGWANVHATRPSDEDEDWPLTRFPPGNQLNELMQLYETYHGAAPLAVARSPSYWRVTLEKAPDDEFYWLTTPAGETVGYARVALKGGAMRIADYALVRDDEALLSKLYDGAIRLAKERNLARIGGWLPNAPAARKSFQLQQRPREITMLKSLLADLKLEDGLLAAADRFCEIDHV